MRKRRKPSTPSTPGRWRTLLQTSATAARPFVLITGLTILALGGVTFGMMRMERWVTTLPQACPPVRIEWADLPDWLCLPDNRHILDDLMTATCVTEDDRLTEPRLAQAVAEKLSDPSVAWVRRVVRVVKRAPDTLVIRCDFRRPIAWVQHEDFGYLVAADGVRLPGRYPREALAGSGLPDVVGVHSAPPPVGADWSAPELHAGLAILQRLKSEPFRHQITGVSVENYRTRQRGDRASLEILTDHPGARIRWGRAPGDEGAAEISADQKVALMNSMYEHTGRIDLENGTVDITNWRDRIVTTAGRQEPAAEGEDRL